MSQWTILHKQWKWHNLNHDDAGTVMKVDQFLQEEYLPRALTQRATLSLPDRGNQPHSTHLVVTAWSLPGTRGK